ncbi:hypothetical protein QM012_006322 [Aureobasidium pullulans]|uniref:Uncharacterized protein n=1 Tax=Aureobasidium pullulans TaxID=5580 RepID=A0ABR0TSW3_AURPU
MIKQALLLVSGTAFASAAYSGPGNTFGSSNNTAFVNADRTPNITKSVPFQMGDRNFTFRVNVAEFTPDVSTTVENPRIAASFYALEWSGGTTLNDTVAAAESLSGAQMPHLCASIPLDLLSAATNNGYNEKDDGDCTGALGKDCVNDLKQTSYELNSACLTSLPKSCASKLDTGGTGSASLLNRNSSQNSSSAGMQVSPFDFFYWSSPVYSAGNDTFYQRESERLHVAIFAGKNTYPVCVRVKTDHLKNESPATSEAAGSLHRSLMPTMMLALSAGFWLA